MGSDIANRAMSIIEKDELSKQIVDYLTALISEVNDEQARTVRHRIEDDQGEGVQAAPAEAGEGGTICN